MYISQSKIDVAIDNLAHQINQSGKSYKYVVGIRNGGVHISEPIAKALGLPHKTVGISYYGNSKVAGDAVISKDFQWEPDGLLVDDLIDTGKTVDCFKDIFGQIDVAVLFWDTNYKQEPEYYVWEKPDAWVVFSWELK